MYTNLKTYFKLVYPKLQIFLNIITERLSSDNDDDDN